LERRELGTRIWWKHTPWRRALETKTLLETEALILVGELLRVLLSHPSSTSATSLPPPSSSSPVCHPNLDLNLFYPRLIREIPTLIREVDSPWFRRPACEIVALSRETVLNREGKVLYQSSLDPDQVAAARNPSIRPDLPQKAAISSSTTTQTELFLPCLLKLNLALNLNIALPLQLNQPTDGILQLKLTN
jgi:hypothetical protein